MGANHVLGTKKAHVQDLNRGPACCNVDLDPQRKYQASFGENKTRRPSNLSLRIPNQIRKP